MDQRHSTPVIHKSGAKNKLVDLVKQPTPAKAPSKNQLLIFKRRFFKKQRPDRNIRRAVRRYPRRIT
jgi:hypothetical protein